MFDPTTVAHIEPSPPSVQRSRRPRSARRHYRNDQRAAVVRAITAARLYATGQVSTLREAATGCGSCPQYVAAAVILLKTENLTLLSEVLNGHMPLLVAAKRVSSVAKLVAAFRTADAEDRIAFGAAVGVANVWDSVIVPQL